MNSLEITNTYHQTINELKAGMVSAFNKMESGEVLEYAGPKAGMIPPEALDFVDVLTKVIPLAQTRLISESIIAPNDHFVEFEDDHELDGFRVMIKASQLANLPTTTTNNIDEFLLNEETSFENFVEVKVDVNPEFLYQMVKLDHTKTLLVKIDVTRI